MTQFFQDIETITYEGPESQNPMAFHHYNPDEVVLGKRLEDHLRFAVAYWHSFAWEGGDPFGGQTLSGLGIRRTQWSAPRLKPMWRLKCSSG